MGEIGRLRYCPVASAGAFSRGWARRSLAIGAIASLAVLLQWSDDFRAVVEPAERIATDAARMWLASDVPEHRILIVDIDEASLSSRGPWPWPRYRVAELVEMLLGVYGAKAVGLDIVFPAPAADAKAGDLRLAALGQNAPVVFSQAFDFVPREAPLQTGVPVFSRFPAVTPALAGQPAVATGYLANHEGLSQSRCAGNIGLRPDRDGRIRRVPLEVAWEGRISPLLPLVMLGCARTANVPTPAPSSGIYPPLQTASWEVPYARQWTSYTVVSAHDILSGVAPADMLGGRWVLVGSSALGLNDRAATPVSSSIAGVMVHAAVLTSLLDLEEGSLPIWQVDGRWLSTLWILLTLSMLGWAIHRLRAWIILPAIFSLVAAWLLLALWWLQHQLEFSVMSPLMAYGAVMLMVPLEWWLLQREQGQILRSFATYVAPAVLQQMLRQGIEHPLTPRYADITVVSADMQNYTGLTSRSSLQEVASLTRDFLRCLTEPVLEQEGTLDKYTGDGLVAFWGAPLPRADHTDRAIEAAKQMVLRIVRWNETRAMQGLPTARVRVGIETGPALVGDLGTAFRSTYTAVGDCINLASKLQAAARNLEVDLVIGPAAAARVAANRSDVVPLIMETLPGKITPVMLWTIKGLPTSSLGAKSVGR